jgi:dihydrolipoamide dehydrogenase
LLGLPFDGKKIITSKEALSLPRFPASITIVGGGVIGCELATFFSALGSKVAVIEYMPRLLPYPNIDKDISGILFRSFKSRGIDVRLSCKIIGLAGNSDRVFLDTEVGDRIESELALVAVGTAANTQELMLEATDVKTDKAGFIPVDPRTLKTSAENIHAIGDVISLSGMGHPALAHIASAEGELAAEFIAKGKTSWAINYDAIPLTIFTDPEIAVCGLTKDEADKRFPEFSEKIIEQSVSENYLGIARALEETDGLDKLVIDSTNLGKILGAQIIGPYAAERIHVWTEAMRAGESAYLMSHQIMAHPTFSEIFREVLLSLDGMAVHVPLAKQIGKKVK